jgi:hypothetical protein
MLKRRGSPGGRRSIDSCLHHRRGPSNMGNAMAPGPSPLGGRRLVGTVDRVCGAFGTDQSVAKRAICGSWV